MTPRPTREIDLRAGKSRRTRLMLVTLELARRRGQPAGATGCGYMFVAPLDAKGFLVPTIWEKEKDLCGAVRLWSGSSPLHGRLRLRRGPAGDVWLLDFDPTKAADDRVGYGFGEHCFVVGAYVTLSDQTGSAVFRVASVEPLDGSEPTPSEEPTAEALAAEADVGYDPRVE